MNIPIEVLDLVNFVSDVKVYGTLVALFAVIKILAYFRASIKYFLKRRTIEMKQTKIEKLQAKIAKATKVDNDTRMLQILEAIAVKLGVDTKAVK